jgi:hypothetical protein
VYDSKSSTKHSSSTLNRNNAPNRPSTSFTQAPAGSPVAARAFLNVPAPGQGTPAAHAAVRSADPRTCTYPESVPEPVNPADQPIVAD